MSDEGCIQLLHACALAEGTQDFPRLMLLQGENDERLFSTVQTLIIVHRHTDLMHNRLSGSIEHQNRARSTVENGVRHASQHKPPYALPAA